MSYRDLACAIIERAEDGRLEFLCDLINSPIINADRIKAHVTSEKLRIFKATTREAKMMSDERMPDVQVG